MILKFKIFFRIDIFQYLKALTAITESSYASKQVLWKEKHFLKNRIIFTFKVKNIFKNQVSSRTSWDRIYHTVNKHF